MVYFQEPARSLLKFMSRLLSFSFRIAAIGFLGAVLFLSCAHASGPRKRIYIIDSYHPEYLWSQETAAGSGQALLDMKFLDNAQQLNELGQRNYIESSKAVVRKAWMDTKRRNSRREIADATARIVNDVKTFRPDIIVLGDDNAANFVGNYFMDTDVPMVFWGINGSPQKYGLIDSLDNPGHNVTGIYQAGYIKECLEFLVQLAPQIKTFASLSDDSETGRARTKELQLLASRGELPLVLKQSVVTNAFASWKSSIERLAPEIDAFVMFNHNTLKDSDGQVVDQLQAGQWYLDNVKKPDCSDARQFVREGILLAVDDSGYKQGYEAVAYVYDILMKGVAPAQLPVKSPARGKVMANRHRAAALGISLDGADFIEEFVEPISLDDSQKGKNDLP